jgi:single-strand DNA-binding protein
MYNKILLIGNLVKDIETKQVGKSTVARFRLAVDDPYREKNTLYIDCEAWDEQAKFAEKWLTKGKGVIVDGRLCMDSWEKDGKKETKFFVKTQDIRFSSSAKKDDSKKESESVQSKQKQTQSNSEEEFSDVPF